MLGGLFTDGQLNISEEQAISSYNNGKPYTAFGDLAVVVDGTPSYTDQGFYYNSAGRLCLASVAAVANYNQGIGYAADGSVCVSMAGTIAGYENGLAFTSTNRLVTTSNKVRPVAERDVAVARDALAWAVA